MKCQKNKEFMDNNQICLTIEPSSPSSKEFHDRPLQSLAYITKMFMTCTYTSVIVPLGITLFWSASGCIS